MRKTVYLLAAALLTVTLCADRATAAAPALRPEVVQLAEKLVSRLSQSFGRMAVAIVAFPQRQSGTVSTAAPQVTPANSQAFVPQRLSPFQFNLPPPAL